MVADEGEAVLDALPAVGADHGLGHEGGLLPGGGGVQVAVVALAHHLLHGLGPRGGEGAAHADAVVPQGGGVAAMAGYLYWCHRVKWIIAVSWCPGAGPALGPGWDTVKHSDDQITPRNHISLGLALGALGQGQGRREALHNINYQIASVTALLSASV